MTMFILNAVTKATAREVNPAICVAQVYLVAKLSCGTNS